MIKAQLSREFSKPMDAYKGLIEESIDGYLLYLDSQATEEDQEVDNAQEPAGSARPAPAQQQSPLGKVPKADVGKVPEADVEEDYVVELSGNKRATVSVFKGAVRVDLREFYEDGVSGGMKATKKGLSLQCDQWLRLREKLPVLAQALNNGEEGHDVELAESRRAYISNFGGKSRLHVREMYELDGKIMPGKVGVTLDASALNALAQAAGAITAAAERRGATASTGTTPERQPAKPASASVSSTATKPAAAAAPPATARQAATQASISPASARGASSSGGSEEFVELGGDKRASISSYMGRLGVDLREYYKSGDGLAPGKKGILLTPQQFAAIARNLPAISRALNAKDTGFELDLGNKRKVSISEFKSKVYVGVREYYEDANNGALKPGLKGLSMNAEQWERLEAAMPRIEAQLASQS